MAPLWQPGVQYNYGDVVEFEGIQYKIIQPHRSQGDWTPPVTPALWGRVQGEYRREEKWGGDCNPPTPAYQQKQQQYTTDQRSYDAPPEQPTEEHKKNWLEEHKKELEIGGGLLAGAAAIGAGALAYNRHQHNAEGETRREKWSGDQQSYAPPGQPAEDHKKGWLEEHKKELEIGGGLLAGAAAIGAGTLAYKHRQHNMEEGENRREKWSGDQQSYDAPSEQLAEEHKKSWLEEHKKQLEIGGGLLAGAAVIGAGMWAYNHHQHNVEEKQAHEWASSHWREESMARTKQWRAGQWNAPVAWIWNEGTSIPRDAIQGGEENGKAIFICRAYHERGLMIGKASSAFKKGGVIGFKKDEIHIDAYEILVGDSRAVRWVSCTGQINVDRLGARPVEGGKEPDGGPIYIAQAPYHGGVHPGKACEVYGDGCFIAHSNTEKKVKEYAVLCYA